jgi:FkbM family methyltransferase
MFNFLLSRWQPRQPTPARTVPQLEGRSGVEQGIEAFCMAYEREPTPEEAGLLGSFLAAVPVSGRRDTLRLVISLFDRQSYHTPVAIRFGQNDLQTVQLGGFKLVCDRLDHAVSSGIINEQHYEPHLTEFVHGRLKPGMTAVDIGANIGFFSMLFSSIVGGNGRVISFEPNTENCRLLLLSKEVNGFDNIELHPIALSNMRGVAFFTPAIGSNGTLLPSTSETLMDPNCVVVPSDRLDNVVHGPVNLIKADVEGAEYLAFSGGIETISRNRPIILAEFSMAVSGIQGKDFLYWIQNLNYSIEMLGRTEFGRSRVDNIERYIAEWGSPGRIEDLAFIPN